MINLEKGQKISLEKESSGIKNVVVGLGWNIKSADTGNDYDIDSSVFLLGENGKLVSDKHFVFYNNLTSPDGAVTHKGDNLTGAGDGDDEQVTVDLTRVDPSVKKIVFVVTIHKAVERKQNFGQIANSYIRVLNQDGGSVVAQYDLSEDFSTDTAMHMGEIYNHNGEWKFSAVGVGKKEGLSEFLNQFKG